MVDMETYRRGHNGNDSKTSFFLGSLVPEDSDLMRVFGESTT